MKLDTEQNKYYKMKDVLNIWHIPIIEGVNQMVIDAIHDDFEGFRVILKDNAQNGRKLRILFPTYYSYRNTNESYLLKLWAKQDTNAAGKIFYTILNSSYIDFFNEMSENIYEDFKITHYSIYTTEDCIEVLSGQEPIVEWLD